ncbi:hypothetical protein D3C83_148810 [compost metagenome]
MYVGAARLDRQRQTEPMSNFRGCGTVREEELRIDEVEGLLGVKPFDQRQDRGNDPARIAVAADFGN